jgi:nucleotide-binding universal stress UspA family protein
MSGIVCAIRGGPHSLPTIRTAVSLARERNQPLYFLYVVNLDFLARTTSIRTHTINQEMEEMGEFILLSAKGWSADHGVLAEGLVRHGVVGEEIVALCKEVGADYLVIGRPQLASDEDNVFTHARLDTFATMVKEQTGAEVIMPEKEQ